MRRSTATLPAVYTGIGLQGAGVGISGLGLPFLIERFAIDKGRGGAIPGLSALGFGLGCLLGGRVADRIGRGAVIRTGLLMMAVGSLGLAGSPWFSLGISFSLLSGIGSGFMEASANAAVVDIAKERAPHALNVLHFLFGLGAVIGPITFALLLSVTGRWWAALVLVGVAMTVTAAWTAFIELPGVPDPVERPREKHAARRLLIVAGCLMLTYVALEFGYAQWAFAYLTELRGASPNVASWAVSGFFLSLAVGRLISARLTNIMSVERLLLGLGVIALAASSLIPFVSTLPVFVLSCILGLGFSGIFPLGVALGGRAVPGSAWVMGVLVAVGAIGAIISPPLMGAIADRSGLAAAMLVIPAGCVLLIACILALPRSKGPLEPIEPPEAIESLDN